MRFTDAECRGDGADGVDLKDDGVGDDDVGDDDVGDDDVGVLSDKTKAAMGDDEEWLAESVGLIGETPSSKIRKSPIQSATTPFILEVYIPIPACFFE